MLVSAAGGGGDASGRAQEPRPHRPETPTPPTAAANPTEEDGTPILLAAREEGAPPVYPPFPGQFPPPHRPDADSDALVDRYLRLRDAIRASPLYTDAIPPRGGPAGPRPDLSAAAPPDALLVPPELLKASADEVQWGGGRVDAGAPPRRGNAAGATARFGVLGGGGRGTKRDLGGGLRGGGVSGGRERGRPRRGHHPEPDSRRRDDDDDDPDARSDDPGAGDDDRLDDHDHHGRGDGDDAGEAGDAGDEHGGDGRGGAGGAGGDPPSRELSASPAPSDDGDYVQYHHDSAEDDDGSGGGFSGEY